MKLFPMFIFYIEDELRFILICPIHEGYRKKIHQALLLGGYKPSMSKLLQLFNAC